MMKSKGYDESRSMGKGGTTKTTAITSTASNGKGKGYDDSTMDKNSSDGDMTRSMMKKSKSVVKKTGKGGYGESISMAKGGEEDASYSHYYHSMKMGMMKKKGGKGGSSSWFPKL
jgi:hypothetical protein